LAADGGIDQIGVSAPETLPGDGEGFLLLRVFDVHQLFMFFAVVPEMLSY
jgi:hypothetical protein